MSRIINSRLYLKYTEAGKRPDQPRQHKYVTIGAEESSTDALVTLKEQMEDREDVLVHNGVFGMSSFYNDKGERTDTVFFKLMEYSDQPISTRVE